MKSLTENQKSRRLNKIDQLKKELKYEKQKFGGYHDGKGIRYSIAELYFEINDSKKTLRYLNWFYKIFPDDITYPHFKLGSSYAYYELKKYDKCAEQLIKLTGDNTYLLYVLVNIEIDIQNKYEPYEFNRINWIQKELENFKMYTNEDYEKWILQFICTDKYNSWYIKYVSILKLIEDLEVSEERTQLLEASYKCINDWIKDYS